MRHRIDRWLALEARNTCDGNIPLGFGIRILQWENPARLVTLQLHDYDAEWFQISDSYHCQKKCDWMIKSTKAKPLSFQNLRRQKKSADLFGQAYQNDPFVKQIDEAAMKPKMGDISRNTKTDSSSRKRCDFDGFALPNTTCSSEIISWCAQ